jgi:hypothetical protein
VKDFVRELALTHRFCLCDRPSLIDDNLFEVVSKPRNLIVDSRIDYEDHFVLSFCFQNNASRYFRFQL